MTCTLVLLVLMTWFFVSLARLPGLEYGVVHQWMSSAWVAIPMALLVISVFYHARLGLQVLVEDYIHQGGSRFALIALLNLVAVAGAVFGIFCIASIAFAGAA